ncbi:MAG TPA: hypothetical protein VLA43_20075 [Longimicrobiales bacterium]|nr:hypothetical protein [Longimicrobiales bacterium]
MDVPFPRLKQLVLPGLVFQSVVIAGGYGTGRELVEFFLSLGPRSGLLAMAVATLVWSLVGVATFEFARLTRSLDYRALMQHLMGPGAIFYEVAYLGMLLLVLAVVAAAAGEIVRDTFGLPYPLGVVGMMALVGFLTLKGSALIEGVLTVWSLLLYVTYAVFAGWAVARFGPQMGEALAGDPGGAAWGLNGVRYAAYNIGILPAVLFVLRDHRSRGMTIGAGLLVGPLGMIPGFLFYIALLGAYPETLERAVPAGAVLEALGSRAFVLLFQVILLGTLVETGTGLIHAVNERVAHAVESAGRPFPRWGRSALAILLLGAGSALSGFGLVGLIARGYGLMTWIFLLVFVLPILTLGSWRILRAPAA